MLFNIGKNLFKWNEDKSRSVLIPVESEIEEISDLGWLRKKSIHVAVKLCAQKSVGMQFHKIVSST